MENKYICPKCGSRLKAYREYIFEKQQLINPKTGQLNKKVLKTKAEKTNTPGGIECIKCDFVYYGMDATDCEGRKYRYLNELFEVLNESEDAEEII